MNTSQFVAIDNMCACVFLAEQKQGCQDLGLQADLVGGDRLFCGAALELGMCVKAWRGWSEPGCCSIANPGLNKCIARYVHLCISTGELRLLHQGKSKACLSQDEAMH